MGKLMFTFAAVTSDLSVQNGRGRLKMSVIEKVMCKLRERIAGKPAWKKVMCKLREGLAGKPAWKKVMCKLRKG